MVFVEFQIICNDNDFEIESYIYEKIDELREEDGQNYILDDDEFLKINYKSKLGLNKKTIGITIEFNYTDIIESNLDDENKLSRYITSCDNLIELKDERYSYIRNLIERLIELLEENEQISIIKFYDCTLKEYLKKYYDEIFEIEMDLRKIFSFILSELHPENLFIFSEIQQNVSPKISYKNEYGSILDKMKKMHQNDIFYLTFSQYRELKMNNLINLNEISLLKDKNQRKTIDKKDFERIGMFSKNKELFNDFLGSISSDLDPVEKMRNCVAHCRMPTPNEFGNYEIAKVQLRERIINFLNRVKYKPIIVTAHIVLEKDPISNLYRQNHSIIEFEDGTENEIDISDDVINEEETEKIESEIKQVLKNYLENDYNIDGLDDNLIEIQYD